MTTFPEGRVVIEDLDRGSSHFQTNETGSVTVIEVNTLASMGDPGPQGDAGEGVPTGGTTGQVLIKDSGTNYDTSWATRYAVPAGGNAEQVLAKASATDGDTEWVNAPSATSSVFVYNSSALQTGNVYADWADLMTAVDGIDGPKIIQFQQAETIPTTGMPVNGWDLNGATLSGLGTELEGTLVTFPNGCKIDNPGAVLATDRVYLYSTSTTPILTVDAATVIGIANSAAVLSKTAEFIRVSATSGNVIIALDSGKVLLPSSTVTLGIEAAGDYEAVSVTSTVDAFVVADYAPAGLDDDTIRGGASAGFMLYSCTHAATVGSSAQGYTQTNATGWTVNLLSRSERITFDGDGSTLAVYTGVENVSDALSAIGEYVPEPGTSGNIMTSDGTDWTSAAPVETFGSFVVPLWVPSSTNGTWSPSSAFDYIFNGSPSDGHWVQWTNVPLGGTYTIGIATQQTNGSGKYQVSIDGVDVGSLLDGYAASNTAAVLTSTDVVIAPGLHTVRVTINGKNASSSGYACRLASVAFTRTA